jgi:energy-coupling factor transporter ATP-binding protein EcfA2
VPDGVLIIGAYGSGKSSLCEELAGVLEAAGRANGAIDLDWLGWYDAPGRRLDHDQRDPVAMANLEAVVTNYVSAGVDHFVLAGAVWSDEELAAIRGALAFPLRVVQLLVAYEEIERRLLSAVSTARANDLEEAKRQSERGDLGLSDVVIVNDRPIWEVADEVLDWLHWR